MGTRVKVGVPWLAVAAAVAGPGGWPSARTTDHKAISEGEIFLDRQNGLFFFSFSFFLFLFFFSLSRQERRRVTPHSVIAPRCRRVSAIARYRTPCLAAAAAASATSAACLYAVGCRSSSVGRRPSFVIHRSFSVARLAAKRVKICKTHDAMAKQHSLARCVAV